LPDVVIKKAMLLAAGRSTRLAAVAQGRPKPMMLIGGRPLMEHAVRQLAHAGVSDVMINLHQHGDAIEAHFGSGTGFGLRVHYSHEPDLLGTGGGIRRCREFFEDAPFFVQYGDNLTTCRLDRLVAHHAQHHGMVTMALYWRDDVSPHSAVSIQPNTRITAFSEKPRREEAPSHWISAGVMVFEPRVLDRIPPTVPCDLGFDVFPQLIADGECVYGYYMTGNEGLWWIDTPEHYQRTSATWKDGFPVL
jgi:mannose-1-phosphate guanylyltransferase